MNLKELSQNRYSVRTYLPRAVETEKIEYILDCARLAPSAVNYQPWMFYVVTDNDTKLKVQESYNREWLTTAPLYIVACKDSSQSWKRSATDGKDFGDVDIAIAAEHICLAAAEIGLGTCWVCNFDPVLLTQALDIPSPLEAVVIFPLGYIDEVNSKVPVKKRKSLSDITRWI